MNRATISGMGSFRSNAACLVLCLAVTLGQGCDRPDAPRTHAQATSSSEQKLPFHQNADRAAPDDRAPLAIPPDGKSPGTTPFRVASHARSLPAGTLITVRLESSLSISRLRAGDSFTASVAGPLTIDGETLIDRGASVSGRIESTQAPGDRPGSTPDPALVRFTLNTITVDGHELPLQTLSLFAKGSLQTSPSSPGLQPNPKSTDFHLLKGRRLTFRLTAPLTLADHYSIAQGQSPDTAKP